MGGWIKLHREMLDKPIWKTSTPEQKVILITLLEMANHATVEWEWRGEKFTCREGQLVTSLDSIAEKAGKGISVQNVRSALKRFEKYEFLTNESTNRGRLITIVNWGVYQREEEKPTDAPTGDQQATNRPLTTNKKEKNVKKEKKENICAFFEELWTAYPNKKGKASVTNKAKAEIEKIGRDIAMECVRLYALETKGTDKQYIKHGSTFFNSGIFDYIDAAKKNIDAASKRQKARQEIPETEPVAEDTEDDDFYTIGG